MDIVPKPRHTVVTNGHKSARSLLLELVALMTDDMAVAVVLIEKGQFHTYQQGCDKDDMSCCAEALEAWVEAWDDEVVLESVN